MASVKTTLRNAIVDCIKEMSVAGGYNYDYSSVNDPAINMEQMVAYPTVNVLYGSERRLNARTLGNNQLYDILLPVSFDVFLHDINDTSLAQDNVLADFQLYFGNNYYVKPADGDRTVFEARFLSDTPWGTEREVPNCGITIDFELYYSIKISNPYSML